MLVMCDPVVPPESMGRGLVQSVGGPTQILYGGVFCNFNFRRAGNRDVTHPRTEGGSSAGIILALCIAY